MWNLYLWLWAISALKIIDVKDADLLLDYNSKRFSGKHTILVDQTLTTQAYPFTAAETRMLILRGGVGR